MSPLLIDTNVLIRYFKGDEIFAASIEVADAVVIHPVVYAEYLSGLDESTPAGREQRRILEEFLDAPAVMMAAMSTMTAIYYSKIYRHLKAIGKMIPQNDIWLAASALENGYELVSHDSHFERIPMLRLMVG